MDSLPPKSESPFLDYLNAFKQEFSTAQISPELEKVLLRFWLAGRLHQMHRDVMREEREKGER